MTLRMLDLGAVVGRKSCADDVVVGAACFLRACVAHPLREHRGWVYVGGRMVARPPGNTVGGPIVIEARPTMPDPLSRHATETPL